MINEPATAIKLHDRDGTGRPSGVAEYDIGSKLKLLRQARKLTLRAVADEMGFSIALLSQIENNNVSPPIQTLWKLSRFYRVPIGSLFSESSEGKRFEIVRKGDRAAVPYPASGFGSRCGVFGKPPDAHRRDRKMVSGVATLSAPVPDATLYSFEGESFIYVLQGALAVLLDNEEIVLEEGDSIYFDTSMSHRMGPKTAAGCVLLEVSLPR